MEFTIYKNKYHNCRNATISAMLKRLGINLDYLWYQAGLYYKETSEGPGGFVYTPNYRMLQDDFKKNHGIEYNEEFMDDVNEFKQLIIELVKSGHHVAIMVDIFHLPYIFYYQENHDLHDIEIVEIKEDRAIICDHYYQYHGELLFDDIKKAVISTMEVFGVDVCILYYFTLTGGTKYEYSTADLIKVLQDNKAVLLGENKVDFSYFYGSEDSVLGIKTLPIMYEKTCSSFEYSQKEYEAFLAYTYKDFKDISNSRYNLHIYLKKFQINNNDFLSSHYFELSQRWSLTANLYLRALLSQNGRIFKDKLLSNIREIEGLEKMSIFKIEKEIKLLS